MHMSCHSHCHAACHTIGPMSYNTTVLVSYHCPCDMLYFLHHATVLCHTIVPSYRSPWHIIVCHTSVPVSYRSPCHTIRYLSTDATQIFVSAFVQSRLDYCNSLMSGCPQYLLSKLHKVQSKTARLILRVSKTDHMFPHPASLYWLPIDSQIHYKHASLRYNYLDSIALAVCLEQSLFQS